MTKNSPNSEKGIGMNQSKSKSLLVTGGAGFIGSSFVQKMVQLGHRVVILDAMTYAGHQENLDQIPGKTSELGTTGSWKLSVGNICNTPLVTQLLQSNEIDAVVHFAAESHVDRSITGPSAFIETNVIGTFSLLSAATQYWQELKGERKQNFRYLQVSTDEVYGSLGPTGKFSETTAYAPNSPYSASKASGDHLVRAWFHTYGLPTLTTNCSNNYGPRQYPEKLIPHMIDCALMGKPLPVYGDGGNVRDWIHVEDHCAGVWLALDKGRPGETYCFGGNAERNNLDVVRTICRELDRLQPRKDGKFHETGIAFVTDRLGHDRRYAIDDSKAQTELGFTRNFNFEQGLGNTVKWYLDHQDWCKSVMKREHK